MADASSRSGRFYGTDEIQRYLAPRFAPHDGALAAAFESPERDGLPAIQLGVLEAGFLEWLVRLAGVGRAVEVGTLAGYSAIHIARGLVPGGRLVTIERDAHHATVARRNIAAAGLADRVEVREGDGIEVLASLAGDGPFDLVFLDADKERYDAYATWAVANLRPGGLIVADNSFFFGRLLGDEPGARAMRRCHETIVEHFDAAFVPTPDGLAVGRRR